MPRVHYKNYRGITLLARSLRKNQTAHEIILWKFLRRKNIIGFKFLRQHPIFYRIDKEWIEFYIADFYCAELRLVIELDGPIHLSRKEYDSERDIKITKKGIEVMRIKNEELNNIETVLAKLKEKAEKRFLQITVI